MKAIILAAGEGVRLRPYTLDRPKCLVELAGQPLIEHQATALRGAGINDIHLVTGYRGDQLAGLGFRTWHNPKYASTNMVASLMCAAELMDGSDDIFVAYADLVYESRVVEALLACCEPVCTTVDRRWLQLWRLRMDDPLADAETLKLDKDLNIVCLGEKPDSCDDIEGQYMGLIKVRADFAAELVSIYDKLGTAGRRGGESPDTMYMTGFLQCLIDGGQPVRAVPVDGGWLEVDSAEDLDLYRRLHSEGALDEFCRLVTPQVSHP